VNEKQDLGGYRTLNLLNAHEDPTFLRAVLYDQIARDYLPAAKANFVKVVINGESWGVYINEQQFNKDFIKEWFGSTRGARWKVPGSPGGRGSLAYLGEDPESYKGIYELKSKEDANSWANLIRLCRVLTETPPEKLEAALKPLLDIDGALKFLALENVFINNDGYWVRSSDYSLYQDPEGRFHVIPHDTNETFGRPGGPGDPGGRGGFNPGMRFASQFLTQGDRDGDGKLSATELTALAEVWYGKMDPTSKGQVTPEQMATGLAAVFPPPEFPGAGGLPGGDRPANPGGRGGLNPSGLIASGLFSAADSNKDGQVAAAEMKSAFGQWFTQWKGGNGTTLDEEQLRNGLSALPPRPIQGGPGGGRGPQGGGVRVEGVKLDPLVAANDASKPLISKLLAVPELRARYLTYIRQIAEKWLDWNILGPIAEQYHTLIAAEVAADTRKLDSTEAFNQGLTQDVSGGPIALKNFADQRRAYLLGLPQVAPLNPDTKPR